MEPVTFTEFPKMARLSRETVISEKLDGTNASIYIDDYGNIVAGSRNKWIYPNQDNYGFAGWVERNKEELLKLGPGHHFGEWWGNGIQRGYELKEKRFSLFNVSRWIDDNIRPSCCHVVPVLWSGIFNTSEVDIVLTLLKKHGSIAAPGFMRPEGVVVWHMAANIGFKKTIEKDETPKSLVK